MESYLEIRKQLVKINNESSECLPVLKGVPQGSVLGTFLFIVYINDLPTVVPCDAVLYADDTILITCDTNLENVRHNMALAMKKCNTSFEANVLQKRQ